MQKLMLTVACFSLAGCMTSHARPYSDVPVNTPSDQYGFVYAEPKIPFGPIQPEIRCIDGKYFKNYLVTGGDAPDSMASWADVPSATVTPGKHYFGLSVVQNAVYIAHQAYGVVALDVEAGHRYQMQVSVIQDQGAAMARFFAIDKSTGQEAGGRLAPEDARSGQEPTNCVRP